MTDEKCQLTSNPLASEINALPERMRKYVHELETDCDPAGEKARIICLEENVAGLTAELERLTRELGTERSGHLFTQGERNWALQERDRLRAALERAESELSVEEVDPDDCRETVLRIIREALTGTPSETSEHQCEYREALVNYFQATRPDTQSSAREAANWWERISHLAQRAVNGDGGL